MTSAFVKEALDKGREMFKWDEKKAAYSGKRQGTKVRGIGVAVSPFSGGSIGFDGLFIIKPDGRMHVPVGHRQPRHALGVRRPSSGGARCSACRGRLCDVIWGNTAKNLPWTCDLGRQPDDARDDARGARGGHRRDQEAAGDRREGTRRQPRGVQGRGRQGHRTRRQHDVRAGGAEGDRARRQVRRPRAAGGHQQLHQDVGEDPRRPGADGGRARIPIRATASRSPSSSASPKSKSTSRPGVVKVIDYTRGRRRRHGASTRAA